MVVVVAVVLTVSCSISFWAKGISFAVSNAVGFVSFFWGFYTHLKKI